MTVPSTEHQPKCTERNAGRPNGQSCEPATWTRRPVPRVGHEAPNRDSGDCSYRADGNIACGAS
ncbi:putative protein 34 [Haloarcula hispanica icosahedral virus 2]|uniref:Uncharacterized protein n=1 Tax=Haloarcula hispanica icosahedral virus 2 TaxID=1154689 RepID=H9AZZ0_9VIRU|nr:putative protein 34 [Haloarcula hispanica icosahedral virus 2]AFD02315.1 putative protein 34 [Haloarcula hispanica icosahedral virus 2]